MKTIQPLHYTVHPEIPYCHLERSTDLVVDRAGAIFTATPQGEDHYSLAPVAVLAKEPVKTVERLRDYLTSLVEAGLGNLPVEITGAYGSTSREILPDVGKSWDEGDVALLLHSDICSG